MIDKPQVTNTEHENNIEHDSCGHIGEKLARIIILSFKSRIFVYTACLQLLIFKL